MVALGLGVLRSLVVNVVEVIIIQVHRRLTEADSNCLVPRGPRIITTGATIIVVLQCIRAGRAFVFQGLRGGWRPEFDNPTIVPPSQPLGDLDDDEPQTCVGEPAG